MKYKIEWHRQEPDEVDLEDYGFEEKTKWEDLTIEEKYEILDSLTEQHLPPSYEVSNLDE